jgi:hypothetical protein
VQEDALRGVGGIVAEHGRLSAEARSVRML